MRSSFKGHYRRILPPLLEVLDFHSNNTTHRPVLQALEVVRRYVESGLHLYPTDEVIPLDGVVDPQWRDLVLEPDPEGTVRVNRLNYELSTLQAVRDAVRTKEVWIAGARRFRNPDEDVPQDFVLKREEYCAALQQPTEAKDFINQVRTALEARLAAFNTWMGHTLPTGAKPTKSSRASLVSKTAKTVKNRRSRSGQKGREDTWTPHVSKDGKVRLFATHGGRIGVTPFEKLADPPLLPRLKAEVAVRWPMTSLLDMLKETDLRVHFSDAFRSATAFESLDRATLQQRLLLCLYGLGTNTGLKRMAIGEHGATYKDLLYVRRRFITKDQLRHAITEVVNAIFHASAPDLGRGHDRLRLRFQEVRSLGPEPLDRVARPLRRPRRDDLLARRAQGVLHLLAAQDVFLVRGGRDDRGSAAPLHRDGRGPAVRRQPRPERGGVRLLPAAGLPAPAPAQGHSQAEALSPRGRQAPGIPQLAARSHRGHQLGPDPPAV